MKRIIYSVVAVILLSSVYSCKDNNLDPLQVDKIQKGKLLALRGTQLQNIYFIGKPGAEFFPRIATAADQFVFEAEFLSPDQKALQSVDIFVLQKSSPTATPVRVLLKNVPFSEFKNDGKYRNAYVTVTLPLADILNKLGLANTFPLPTGTVNTLLTNYKFGIGIESDLNLTDGTVAPASKVVAAGLFQSDQFYPAQKLVYTVTDYCPYVASAWAGGYDATEVYSNSAYGPYTLNFTQDGSDQNRFNTTNFWDSGYTAYMVFTPSTNPSTQKVSFPAQSLGGGGTIDPGSSGTYDQCTGILNINLVYKEGGASYPFRYNMKKK